MAELHPDGVEYLTTAIVKRAVDDIIESFPYCKWSYERLLHVRDLNRRYRISAKMRDDEDAMRFLRSAWFQNMFPNVDGELLIRMAIEQGEENVQKDNERHRKKTNIIKGHRVT